jgi:hypothetical protein
MYERIFYYIKQTINQFKGIFKMALFLSESVNHISNKEVSDIDMMTSLMEAQQEMAMFTESVLRADFILHEQCRTLLENEGEVDSRVVINIKNESFLSRVWDGLIKIFHILMGTLAKIIFWVKNFLYKFFNRITGTDVLVAYESEIKFALEVPPQINACINKIGRVFNGINFTLIREDNEELLKAIDDLEKLNSKFRETTPVTEYGTDRQVEIGANEIRELAKQYDESNRNLEKTTDNAKKEISKIDKLVKNRISPNELEYSSETRTSVRIGITLINRTFEISSKNLVMAVNILKEMQKRGGNLIK